LAVQDPVAFTLERLAPKIQPLHAFSCARQSLRIVRHFEAIPPANSRGSLPLCKPRANMPRKAPASGCQTARSARRVFKQLPRTATPCRPARRVRAPSSPPILFNVLQLFHAFAVRRAATPSDSNRHKMPQIRRSNCSSHCSSRPASSGGFSPDYKTALPSRSGDLQPQICLVLRVGRRESQA